MAILDPGYYTESELGELPFKELGKNVKIGKNSTFIGIENISIGSNIRIDGNVTVAAASGSISIGNYVHIGGGCHFSCSGTVLISDFCTISQGVRIYSASDDYGGEFFTNPTTPSALRREIRGPVILEKYVIIGSGSVVLPNLTINEGAAVGALSLVKKDLQAWSIYAGSPAKKIKKRSKKLLSLNWPN
jgi:acetyltransferase-like isoleucine patch superfamily enzyme